MNISPRTGRVTLTKMDRQTVERFASLARAMHHHLVQSKDEQDVKIGKAALVAGVSATVLIMTIDGLDSLVVPLWSKPDAAVAENVSVDGQSGVEPPSGDLSDAPEQEPVKRAGKKSSVEKG